MAAFSYAYDGGNLPVAAHMAAEGNPASGNYTYGYDAAGRLTTSTSGFETVAYGYDASGNMKSKTYNPGTAQQDATTYEYDNANQLTDDSKGDHYSYDDCGNLTSISGGSRAATTYSYNTLGQMTSAAVGTTNVTNVDYGYDPLGRVTARTVGNETSYYTMRLTGDEPVQVTASGTTQQYCYTPTGTRALGMKDSNGNTQSFGLDPQQI